MPKLVAYDDEDDDDEDNDTAKVPIGAEKKDEQQLLDAFMAELKTLEKTQAAQVLMDKLLVATRAVDKSAMLLYTIMVELRTRHKDWAAGVLDAKYFEGYVETVERQIEVYESSALMAPKGWRAVWDQHRQCYGYLHVESGYTVSDYPTSADPPPPPPPRAPSPPPPPPPPMMSSLSSPSSLSSAFVPPPPPPIVEASSLPPLSPPASSSSSLKRKAPPVLASKKQLDLVAKWREKEQLDAVEEQVEQDIEWLDEEARKQRRLDDWRRKQAESGRNPNFIPLDN